MKKQSDRQLLVIGIKEIVELSVDMRAGWGLRLGVKKTRRKKEGHGCEESENVIEICATRVERSQIHCDIGW